MSFRLFLVFGALLVLPGSSFAAATSTFGGTAASVLPCSNLAGSYLVSFSGAAQGAVVFQGGVSKSTHGSVVPSAGDYLFGLSLPGSACTAFSGSSSQIIYYYASTTPAAVVAAAQAAQSRNAGSSVSGFGSGSNALLGTLGVLGSSFLSGSISNLLGGSVSNLFGGSVSSILGGSISGVLGSSVSSALGGVLGNTIGTSGGGLGFFGGFITPIPTVCDNGLPYKLTGTQLGASQIEPMIWIPGASAAPPYLYAMGTPPAPGWIIGHYVQAACLHPPAVPIPMLMIFGYGTGGPGIPNIGGIPASGGQNAAGGCPQSLYPNLATNADAKAAAEAAARNSLPNGVTVNKNACGLNMSFQATSGGCTDLSGLQCGSMTDIQKLASECGGFQITAGSELGHETHGAGNAVDVSSGVNFGNSVSQCIENSFPLCGTPACSSCTQNSTGKKYCDPTDGTTFWQENVGTTQYNTGAHWHICFGGKGC